MEQLFMCRKKQPVKEYKLPEGFEVVRYQNHDEDGKHWLDICHDGLIPEADMAMFDRDVVYFKNVVPERDIFFIKYGDEYVATITAVYDPEKNTGIVHMVGALSKYRGRGIGNYILYLALSRLESDGADKIYLHTDDFRKAAVKSYITGGFLPIEFSEGMKERWIKLIGELGIQEIEMVYEDGSHCCVLKAE